MGLFDTIEKLQKLADDPTLGEAALAIGQTAQSLPVFMASVDQSLKALIGLQTTANATLLEISMGLDSLADPIKRPPFHVGDVEAAMAGNWPLSDYPPRGERVAIGPDEDSVVKNG